MNSAALSEWVARRRRSLLFLLMLPVAAGLGAAFALPVALFPDIQLETSKNLAVLVGL